MGYHYQGNHTGPDLFDTTGPARKVASPYEAQRRAERAALLAYWYERGHNDNEIAEQTGYATKTVMKWRVARGLRSNNDLTKV
jgi:hypothetical protein